MHCVSENEIYTGEAQNWRVQRVTMKPAPRQRSNDGTDEAGHAIVR